MSLLTADLPSDPEALKAFAPAFQAELYAKTLHLEKLKAQLAVLKRARYGRSSEKLDGKIEQLELTIGELEEGAAESQARTAAAQTSDAKPSRPRRETSGRQVLPEHLPCETAQHPAAYVSGERRYRARSAAG
jgi:transposase